MTSGVREPLHQLTPQQYESTDVLIEPLPLFDQRWMAIRDCGPKKGRGVFASVLIPARTVIDVSPVLLFPTDEYNAHGRYTQLDHYTYRWPGGMALALGLGSMFNHSNKPNVGYQRLFDQRCIRYSTLRDIQAGEELFISYGNVWFPEVTDGKGPQEGQEQEEPYIPSSDISDGEDETGDVFMSKVHWSSDEDEV
ncbi:hypothetical protein DFQ27_001281 [Actinomortierella ambigua]|uniref:SET domain-containing protein n=1 Tax=Actinomortierella ambigua TaxID=1343610 RepID=A0A9P6QCX2_9FUNG|nr:hypothetical protein DFQ27_001281 [Actinomortierella ambigua]